MRGSGARNTLQSVSGLAPRSRRGKLLYAATAFTRGKPEDLSSFLVLIFKQHVLAESVLSYV